MMFHLYGFFIGLAIVTGYSIAEKIEPRVKDGAGYIIFAGIVARRVVGGLFVSAYTFHVLLAPVHAVPHTIPPAHVKFAELLD